MQKYGARLLTAAVFFAFLLCPAACADGVRAGLTLAARDALPALFPFFLVGGLLVRTGAANALAGVLAKPLWYIYGLPPDGAGALVMGLIGGYPVGAATVAQLMERGRLSREDAARLAAFCNCASPAFCINLAGLMLFGSARVGILLYLLHVLAALLTGLAVTRRPPRRTAPPARAKAAPSEAFVPAFCASVRDAAQTALTVTAFLAVFSVLLALLEPVLSHVSAAPALAGMLELTCGLDRLRMLPAAPAMLPLVSFLLGFGGLSVHGQVHALLTPYNVPLQKFTRGKLLHGLFAAGLTALLLHVSPAAVSALSPAASPSRLPDAIAAFLLLLLVLFPFWGGKRSKDTV